MFSKLKHPLTASMRRLALPVFMLVFTCAGRAHFGAQFEPPDGTVYHGCGWNGYDSQTFYHGMFPVDHHPLILQVMADIPGTRGIDVARLIRALTEPVVHPDSQYIEYGLHFRDRSGMLDSVFALTTTMDHYLDTLAQAFRSVDRPFFLRIGFEFNGDWNPYHPYIFPLAFRKLVTGLHERGVQNFATVWCYEPDAPADFADSSASGWKWYPGDEAVDWFGLDLFDVDHFDPSLPDTLRGQLTKKGRTEAFLRFAQARRKPVYLNELSARNVFIVPDTLDPGSTEGLRDWEYWFVPFFQFVNNHPIIKGWNYINLDWTRYEIYETWGDARLEINSYIRERWVDSLLSSRFVNAGYDITQPASTTRASFTMPAEIEFSVYPNPFNSSTTFSLKMPQTMPVQFEVFDLLGRQVESFPLWMLPAGIHQMSWRCSSCATGFYIARVRSGNRTVQQQVLMLR